VYVKHAYVGLMNFRNANKTVFDRFFATLYARGERELPCEVLYIMHSEERLSAIEMICSSACECAGVRIMVNKKTKKNGKKENVTLCKKMIVTKTSS